MTTPINQDLEIAGVEVPVDEYGRVSLNAMHRASGCGSEKGPGRWMRSQQAQELVEELRPNLASEPIAAVSTGKPGTYAHPDLAISYAGWISPAFQLQVNQTFRAYQQGTLQPDPRNLSRKQLIYLALEAEEEAERLALENQRIRPYAELGEAVSGSDDTRSVGECAQALGWDRISYSSGYENWGS